MFWLKLPEIRLTVTVCLSKIEPNDSGCFINKNMRDRVMLTEIRSLMISRNSLIKILILEIRDGKYSFLDVFKGFLIFSLQD